jgi:hypothetical protein
MGFSMRRINFVALAMLSAMTSHKAQAGDVTIPNTFVPAQPTKVEIISGVVTVIP